MSQKIYLQHTYDVQHWAMQSCKLTDPKVIAIASFQPTTPPSNIQYAIYLNPIDKRGYRCIVRLINNDNMSSTFNRDYSSHERIGLSLLLQLTSEAYNNMVPISQIAIAGNNSHEFHLETGVVQLGKVEEPSFLHGHVFGRGNPNHCYVDGVKLDGPNPGLLFDMLAKTCNEEGNECKVDWKMDGDMERVVERLREEIKNVMPLYKLYGIDVQM